MYESLFLVTDITFCHFTTNFFMYLTEINIFVEIPLSNIIDVLSTSIIAR